ncbi:threonine/serine exporter family protein [Sporosarcina obsidiansis]|uniref:threonine/serine exporter family protein n=1 Tax=Sporosarcina obsidiansis TaxID=2660748 RepID=UPI00129B7D98|nr:threonine/serine exporter family protein [Sporosarcina obsidiansis]
MYVLIQGLLSFFAALGFGIIFNAPRKMLFHCGLVGGAGWLIYLQCNAWWTDPVKASFLGAFTVSVLAHLFAKAFRMPMIIFSVAGIIPLVPGGLAYNAMRHVVEHDYLQAIPIASQAFMVSGAIAMGLVFAEVMIQLLFKFVIKNGALSK